MFGIKKKLTSLIPSEARAHLQNALTVEWDDGNKTVLVDIPDGQNDDVELEGITGRGGRGRSNSGAGYGRLADDDDNKYTRAYRGPSRGQSYSSHDRSFASASASAFGSGSGSSSSYNQGYNNNSPYASKSSSNHKNLPPLPARSSGQASNRETYNPRVNTSNPFEEEADYPSPVPSNSTYASSGPGASPFIRTDMHSQFGMQNHFGVEMGVPNSNGSVGSQGSHGAGRKVPSPWASFRADEVDMLGEEEPSREGRDQNPFR